MCLTMMNLLLSKPWQRSGKLGCVCGGGLNIDEARTPAVISAGGVSIAFLGYSELADIFWTYSYPRSFRRRKRGPALHQWMRR